ncbi:MAG TPA: YceI family protein [Gemmatimonadales bacterium]|jgi:polyisoprenoid-binding protein YceI
MTATSTALAPWQIDAAHTDVEFAVRHLMISNVKGRFAGVSGMVDYDRSRPDHLALDVTISVASVDTRNEQRDTHLRSADFFDVEHYPEMTFKARRVDGDVTGEFKLPGELTIRGVTKPVTFAVTAEGRGDDPWGNERLGFSATAEVHRLEFGLHYNPALETGGVVVGDKVKISINTELMRPKPV